jgi:hypothetical protein
MFPKGVSAPLATQLVSNYIPVLYAAGRVPGLWVGFASMDATWLVLFVVAYLWTPKEPRDGKA